jgi:hypothetical protein
MQRLPAPQLPVQQSAFEAHEKTLPLGVQQRPASALQIPAQQSLSFAHGNGLRLQQIATGAMSTPLQLPLQQSLFMLHWLPLGSQHVSVHGLMQHPPSTS